MEKNKKGRKGAYEDRRKSSEVSVEKNHKVMRG